MGIALRVNITEILLVTLVTIIISVSIGVTLFGVLGIAPTIGWSMIAVALLLIVLISVVATLVFYFAFRAYASERAVKVAMMALSEEERVVLRQVMNSGGEIRQDHLWRQLDFSKPKLSALVNNLERKGAISRTRYHRTNILKLTKEFGGR
jgi:uncharacterized membrane protein